MRFLKTTALTTTTAIFLGAGAVAPKSAKADPTLATLFVISVAAPAAPIVAQFAIDTVGAVVGLAAAPFVALAGVLTSSLPAAAPVLPFVPFFAQNDTTQNDTVCRVPSAYTTMLPNRVEITGSSTSIVLAKN